MNFLTVTLHPAIDRVIEIDRLMPGGTFDGRLKLTVPSGKGINTARSLRRLLTEKSRMKILAAAWIGENEAPWFKAELSHEGLVFCAMPRACATRLATTFLEVSRRETHVKECMLAPTAAEQVGLGRWTAGQKFPHVTVAAMCGSAPPRTSSQTLQNVLRSLRKQSKILIADTNGPFLEAAGNAGLDGLKGNAAEIGAWLGMKNAVDPGQESHLRALRGAVQIENRKSKIKNGPRAIMVTLGSRGALLVTTNGLWHAKPPKVSKRQIQSATGCGDAATAGWMWGLSEKCAATECLRRAVACGTAKLASADPGGLNGRLARRLLRATQVNPL